MNEGETIKAIRHAVMKGVLIEPFRRVNVRHALGRNLPVAFLPKHRIGNPDGETELFDQLERGLYQLSPARKALCESG